MTQSHYTNFWRSQFPMIMGIIALLSAIGAKNWGIFIASTLVAFGLLLFVIYRVKTAKANPGEPRFKVGLAAQLATAQGRPFWIIGAVCFSLLATGAIVSLVGGEGGWHSLSSALVSIGLIPTFFIPIFPRVSLWLSLIFAACFFAAGGASMMEAVELAKSTEPNTSLQVTKLGLYASMLLIAGGIPLVGMAILKIKGSPTPQTILFENGFYSQRGFLPWEIVSEAKLARDSHGPVLQIPVPGNVLQMSVEAKDAQALAEFLARRTQGFVDEANS